MKGLPKLTLKLKIKSQAQGKGKNLICHLVYQTWNPYWEQALLFLDYKATMFSERWDVTLLRHDTLLFAWQSWLSCKAETLIPQASSDSPSRKRMCSIPGLANERGAHQPEGGGQQRESLREDKRSKRSVGPQGATGKEARAKKPHTREEPYSKVRPHKATSKSCSTRTSSSLKFYSGLGVMGILNVGIPTVPALLMAGLAPFSAHNLFPPKGTYCWDEGRLSVLRSCLLCLSRRIECTAFRKSFRLSGELWKEDVHVRETVLNTRGTSNVIKCSQTNTPEDRGLRLRPGLSFPCWAVFALLRTEHTYSFPSMLCNSSPATNMGQSSPLVKGLMDRWISAPRSCQILFLALQAELFILNCFYRKMNHKILTLQSSQRQISQPL